MNLQPIKTNELFKDSIIYSNLSPFIALTYLLQLGVVLSGMDQLLSFVTFLLVRLADHQENVFICLIRGIWLKN